MARITHEPERAPRALRNLTSRDLTKHTHKADRLQDPNPHVQTTTADFRALLYESIECREGTHVLVKVGNEVLARDRFSHCLQRILD